MSNTEKTVETTVTTEDVNIDDFFNAAPGAEAITLPDEKKPNIFSVEPGVDMESFTKPTTETEESTEITDTVTEEVTDVKKATEPEKEVTEETPCPIDIL